MMQKFIQVAGVLIFSIGIAVCCQCVVPSGSSTTSLTYKLVQSGDTLSPFVNLELAFSEPVEDSAELRLVFQPPFFSYAILINKTHDTATVAIAEPLFGSTHYTIRTLHPISAKSGAQLEAGSDPVAFFTAPLEKEPNNSSATADTLDVRCFGSLRDVNDKDLFCLDKQQSVNAVILTSYGSQSTLFLRDAAGDTLAPERFGKNDTLRIPSGFSFPVIATVSSWQKSAGGYYCLTRVSLSE